jgi:hypothetical protein
VTFAFRARGIAVVLALLAACTSGPDEPGPVAAPSDRVTPSPSAVPTTSAVPAKPWVWQTLLKQRLDSSIIPVYDGRHLVTSTEFVAGGTDLTVKDIPSGRVVLRYDTPPSYVVQGVWLDGRWMVVEETEFEPKRYDIRVYRFDLASGAVRKLYDDPRLPRPTEPDVQAAGGVLAYVADDPSGRQCIHRLAIASLSVQRAGCVPRGTVLGDPTVGADSSVTYSAVEAPGTPKRCKHLFHWPAGGTGVMAVPAVRECAQWNGALAGGGMVWAEVGQASTSMAYADGWARTPDGDRLDLGLTVTGTIEPCAGWIYWKAPVNGRPGGLEAIRRWRPGDDAEEVLRAASTNEVLSPPVCSGSLLVARIDTLDPPSATVQSHSAA